MDNDRYKDKSKKIFFSETEQKFKKNTRGRPRKYDHDEIRRLWEMYKNGAFWNNEEPTIRSFAKKHGFGEDTVRRILGRKPMDSLNEYPKKSS